MTTLKLNQIIAIEKGVKNTTDRALTDLYHDLDKPALMAGISRSYQPNDDAGETLPPESTRVQVMCEDVLAAAAKTLTRLLDVTAAKDYANTIARADVVVDGVILVEKAPVPYLLFLEKQLIGLLSFVNRLPTLDPAKRWTFDEAQNAYQADRVQVTRGKKVPRNHVMAPATDRHPAQVQVFHEDVIVGVWTKIEYSGALPVRRVAELRERVEKLQQAVKFAREDANGTEAADQKVGAKVFGYLLG